MDKIVNGFNVTNLRRLSELLREIPNEDFDISSFSNESGSDTEAFREGFNPCGTVNCAVGWMPTIEPVVPEDWHLSQFDWDVYSIRVFTNGLGFEQNTFDFLFGGMWAEHDNTTEGVIRRIDDFILYGCDVDEILLEYEDILDRSSLGYISDGFMEHYSNE